MKKQWFRTAFGPLYQDLYAHRDEAEAERTVDLITRHCGAKPGDWVLDAPCGAGRHACEFAARGYHVAGVDLSPNLIETARSNCGDSAALVRADVRRFPFPDTRFDLVVNLFSSFGYFAQDEENFAVLGELARVCRRDGHVVVDFMNADQVKARLKPHTIRSMEDGLRVEDFRTITPAPERVEKRTTITTPQGEQHELFESVRLFSVSELKQAMIAKGLEIREILGDYDGNPFKDDSPRVILFGRKP